jgi:hypothetical protein
LGVLSTLSRKWLLGWEARNSSFPAFFIFISVWKDGLVVIKEAKSDVIWVGAATGGLLLAFILMMVLWQVFNA